MATTPATKPARKLAAAPKPATPARKGPPAAIAGRGARDAGKRADTRVFHYRMPVPLEERVNERARTVDQIGMAELVRTLFRKYADGQITL